MNVAAAPLWCAVAGVLGGALLVMRLPPYLRALGVPLFLPVLLWQPLRPEAGQFEILGADIGQGNAPVVRTASHSLVYGTSPKFSRESDAGNRVLVPLLRAMGEKIDLLMLSHRDMDHIGGAPAVLAMQPQARLVSPIEDGHELQVLRPSERCLAGQKWRCDGVDFEVLHPLASDYDGKIKSNAMSRVLRISNGMRVALLAGDLEAAQELRLVASPELSSKLKAAFCSYRTTVAKHHRLELSWMRRDPSLPWHRLAAETVLTFPWSQCWHVTQTGKFESSNPLYVALQAGAVCKLTTSCANVSKPCAFGIISRMQHGNALA